MTHIEKLDKIIHVIDKLIYWSGTDEDVLDEDYNLTNLIIDVRYALNELEAKSKRLEKVEALLGLYRNLEAWVEEYNTADSTLRKQGLLAEIRVARHLIAELESEMK